MSSGQISPYENEMIRLRLEHWLARIKLEEVGRLTETDTKTENDQQNVSSLDANKKLVERKNVENAYVKPDSHYYYQRTRYSDTAIKRLQKELKKMSEISFSSIGACLKKDNLFEWEASIQGP